MPLTAGARLGPFEIIAPLGAGGMGEVYRARDTRLDRTVAVKVLPSNVAALPDVRQRFEREARAVSSLNHPHICALYDVGSENGVDYLIMEYLEGETLARRLERGPLPLDEMLRTAVQIADALAVAHRHGFLHRDLKPGNIMMTKGGAKLLDFGLAKPMETATAVSGLTAAATATTPLTAQGTIVGTFQYMAPEVLEGREADARSDLFALGAVLYEAATGRRAFEGRTQAGLIASILKEEPRPIAALAPLTPPGLERALRRCLAKDPEERWQTAQDLTSELRWIAEAGSQAGVPAPVTRRRRSRESLAWTAAVVSLLAAAALGALALRPAGTGPRVVRSSIPAPEGTEFNLQSVQPGPASISRDGRRLAFAARDAKGSVQLWVRSLDSDEAQPLAGTEGASYPFWSPDGRSIGFFAAGALKRIDAGGGPSTRICDASTGKGGSWNREGVILFSPTFNSPLHRVPAEGGKPEPVTRLDAGRGENSHRFPEFLPDGRRFIFLSRAPGGGAGGGSAIRTGELGSDRSEILFLSQTQASYAAGHLLYVQEGTLMARPFDPDRLAFIGEAAQVAKGVRTIAGAFRGVFAASDTGEVIFQKGGSGEGSSLQWLDRSGAKVGTLGDRADSLDTLALSPDGKRVAIALTDSGSGTSDIWTYDVARGTRTRVTIDEGAENSPVWSPDGNRIAFSSDRQGSKFDIYVKVLEASSEPELLLAADAAEFPTSWSRDGRYVAYNSLDAERGGGADIWILPVSGDRKPFPLAATRFIEGGAVFSPDGRWVAFASDETGRIEIYVASFSEPAAKWAISTGGGTNPLWRRDGRELYFIGGNGEMMAAGVATDGERLVIGEVRTLFPLSNAIAADVTADGERFLVIAGDEISQGASITLIQNWPSILRR